MVRNLTKEKILVNNETSDKISLISVGGEEALITKNRRDRSSNDTVPKVMAGKRGTYQLLRIIKGEKKHYV